VRRRSRFRGPIGVVLLVAAMAGSTLLPLASSPAFAQAGTMQKIRYGTVVAVSAATVKTQSDGTGAVVGSTAGAVAGYALVGGRDRWLGGLVGGVLGGAAGKGIEKAARKKKGWQLIVKLDGGEEIGIDVPGKKKLYQEGDRVRLMSGPGGQTKVTVIEE
jgi:outer membrane lipoprotein SlyB